MESLSLTLTLFVCGVGQRDRETEREREREREQREQRRGREGERERESSGKSFCLSVCAVCVRLSVLLHHTSCLFMGLRRRRCACHSVDLCAATYSVCVGERMFQLQYSVLRVASRVLLYSPVCFFACWWCVVCFVVLLVAWPVLFSLLLWCRLFRLLFVVSFAFVAVCFGPWASLSPPPPCGWSFCDAGKSPSTFFAFKCLSLSVCSFGWLHCQFCNLARSLDS